MKPPYELIAEGLRKGRVIPFLGSGASILERHAGQNWDSPGCRFLPKADELAKYLDRLSGYPSREPAELARVAQYFDGIAGRGSLDDRLHEIFAGSYHPGTLHSYLPTLGNLLIVTTNYDQLIEQAYLDAKRPFHLVVYNTGSPTFFIRRSVATVDHLSAAAQETVWNELDLEVGKMPILFKMHGSADPTNIEGGRFVITEDDYVKFLA